MKFKHTFHVFVDNFNVIYKQLLYRIIVMAVVAAINVAAIYPFISELLASEQMTTIMTGIGNFIKEFLSGEVGNLHSISDQISRAFDEFLILLQNKMTELVLCAIVIFIMTIIQKWFTTIGNFATATLLNDKMALQANTSFTRTLISTFRTSSIFALIYAPICVIYDFIILALLVTLVYFYIAYHFIPLLAGIFLFSLIIVGMNIIKMTFTSDWLPALIAGKKGQREAIVYSFSRKKKRTWNIVSNYFVLILIIIAINMAATFLTLMAGLILTVPASFVILISFEFVNYYDREEIRYFTDKSTIIKPTTEKHVSREDFFKGNE